MTTLSTVEVTVMAGGIDTEVTVEGRGTEVMVTSWVVIETSTIAGGWTVVLDTEVVVIVLDMC